MKTIRYAPLLFCLGLALTAPSFGNEKSLQDLIQLSRQKRLAADPYWLRLLHMRTGWFGKKISDVDGEDFFLSPQGRKNPQAELEATLAAFFESPPADPDEQHPQCRYPERTHWLKSNLPFPPDLVEQRCDRFEAWRDKLAPQGVSLVFASYYMNNPASMYGHTFLRLSRQGKVADAHLLDYTVNFSAVANTNNGLMFAFLGLTGGYRGTFSTEPYYVKVQKYNNLESRDLWEYTLKVDAEGLNRMVRHLWEVGATSMSYYFLNKNCSYQLLPLLEVARPDLDLVERFTVRAIPLDTLRAVITTSDFVTDIKYRPSHLRRMRVERDLLTRDEQDIASDFTQRPESQPAERLNRVPSDRRALVLDAAYDYLRFKSGFYRDQPEKIQKIEHEILTLRNQTDSMTTVPPERPAPPEAAHGSGRIGVGAGVIRSGSYEEVSVRGSLHDLESDPTGFIEGSQLEMFHARLRYDNQRGKAYLHEGTMVHVRALTPWETWVRMPSWGLKFGFDTARDLERDPEDTIYFGLSGGSGLTLRVPGLSKGLWYAMIEGDSGVGGVFDKHYRLGLGGTTGLVFNVTDFWRIHGSAVYRRYGAGNIGSANILRLGQSFAIQKGWEMRLDGERQNAYKELTLKLNRFF